MGYNQVDLASFLKQGLAPLVTKHPERVWSR